MLLFKKTFQNSPRKNCMNRQHPLFNPESNPCSESGMGRSWRASYPIHLLREAPRVVVSHVGAQYYHWSVRYSHHHHRAPWHPCPRYIIHHNGGMGQSYSLQPSRSHPYPHPRFSSSPYIINHGPRLRYSPYPMHHSFIPISRGCPRRIQQQQHQQQLQQQVNVDQPQLSQVKIPTSESQSVHRNNETACAKDNEDTNESGPGSETLCVICLEAKKSILFSPCFHMSCCQTCAYNPCLKKCPICRADIRAKNQVFW